MIELLNWQVLEDSATIKATKATKGNNIIVSLDGVIDDDVNWEQSLGYPPSPPTEIHLECSKVSRINSVGVKGWIDYFHRLEVKKVPLHMWKCSPAIIQQINQVENFKCGATIHSLQASFSCDSCQHIFYETLTIKEILDQKLVIAHKKCPKCGASAAFDDLPKIVFKFLVREAS